MSGKKRTLSEEEIDDIVTAQADDDAAWGKPVNVRRSGVATVLAFEGTQFSRLPVSSDPEILGGAPVFRGTRVPVAALLDDLAAGRTVDDFLDNSPAVTREQVIKVLEFFRDAVARLGRAA